MNKFKSALEVFDRKQKRNLVYMAIMIFLQSIAELLGVTIILPFINAIVDPDALMQEPYIRWIYDIFHMDNIEQLIILLAIAIIFIYILKIYF